ncbi:lipocalin [Chlorobaculum limnaeum]|jgi:apolipoprotein D and lipocalin family protein|uniref:Lipocalin n=1 Tax=Chlorobaculum limnaeum TaxID=274537 RepID=A0A1D8D5C1_CHLLM|nr:lipocalin family protein [Chlorobaculum limnaeum]AOS83654.1 lipocalin [Chlorobaculum limnaeum]
MFKNFLRKRLHIGGPGTVPQVDVLRYCGTWYEIASIPPKEQRRCTNTKAEYTFDAAKGRVLVRNSCRRNGREASIRATAVPVEGSGNAKLIVTFFRFIKGDYWVIGLADDYSWALVSDTTGTRCWVLSRTPYMDEVIYRQLLDQLRLKGIDTAKLVKTAQG